MKNIQLYKPVVTVKGKGIVTGIDPDAWIGCSRDPYRVEISIYDHLNNDIVIPIQAAKDDKIIYWLEPEHIIG